MRLRRTSARPFGLALIVGVSAAGMLALSPGAVAQTPPAVTFARDIAPILQRSCQNCHNPDGGAPMSLVTYEEVRPWARAVKIRTAAREMPPWFVEPHIGIQKFKDDPRLSDQEIEKIAAWVDGGAPLGNPADLPPPRKFVSSRDWSIGTPDLVVSSPAFTVKAVDPDWHAQIGPVPSGLTEDRYVKAVEVKEVWLTPDGGKDFRYNKAVIHHAGVHTGPPDVLEKGAAPIQGLGGGQLRITYEVGQNAQIYPDNAAVIVKAGAVVLFSMHTHSNGKETPARVDVGFKFHPKGFTPKYTQSGFELLGQVSDELEIPPGQDGVRFDGFYRFQRPAILVTYEPHMHSSGKRMCMDFVYPDGRREMVNCSAYNHNWVRRYTYEDDAAPLIPAGTVMHLIGWYNNSASNRLNVEPRNWKVYGNRTIEDMFHLLPKVTWLTEAQYREELAAREAAALKSTAP